MFPQPITRGPQKIEAHPRHSGRFSVLMSDVEITILPAGAISAPVDATKGDEHFAVPYWLTANTELTRKTTMAKLNQFCVRHGSLRNAPAPALHS